MTYHVVPKSLDAGLRELRLQMAAPFTKDAPAPVTTPISFAEVANAGLAGKDDIVRRSPSP